MVCVPAKLPAPELTPDNSTSLKSPPRSAVIAADPPAFPIAVVIDCNIAGGICDAILGATVAAVVVMVPSTPCNIVLPSVNVCCTEPSISVSEDDNDASPIELVNSFANASFKLSVIPVAT